MRNPRIHLNVIGWLILLVYFTVLMVFLNYLIISSILRQYRSAKFPSTEGIILANQVEEHSDDDGTSYTLYLEYKYLVNNTVFEGQNVRFSIGFFRSSCRGLIASKRYPVDKKVPVYFDPDHPQISLLQTGIEGGDFFPLIVITPFDCLLLYFWSWMSGALYRLLCKPEAGGVKIIKGLQNTRIRLAPTTGLGAAVGAVALSSVISIFVILSKFEGDAPLHAMKITGALILGVGAIFGIWQAFANYSGKYDLVIDEQAGLLELPISQGRKSRVRVPFQNVERVYLKSVVKQDSEGGSRTDLMPAVEIKGEPPTTELLVHWQSELKSRDFVDWLCLQLPQRSKETGFPLSKKGGGFPHP